MQNGVVTIDFTREMMDAAQGDTGVQMIRAVVFTASQFPGVKEVRITVEGAPLARPEEAKTTFLNQDTEIMTYYPGVIEMD